MNISTGDLLKVALAKNKTNNIVEIKAFAYQLIIVMLILYIMKEYFDKKMSMIQQPLYTTSIESFRPRKPIRQSPVMMIENYMSGMPLPY